MQIEQIKREVINIKVDFSIKKEIERKNKIEHDQHTLVED